MKGQTIPDKDHVSRYCKPKSISENGAPTGQSFALRPDEPYLSVNWLEYYENLDQEEQIDHVRVDIELKRLATNGLFAVLNVGELIDYIRNVRTLTVTHEPTKKDPSHSGIKGYDIHDQMVTDMIAEKVIKTYPTKVSSPH